MGFLSDCPDRVFLSGNRYTDHPWTYEHVSSAFIKYKRKSLKIKRNASKFPNIK